MKFNYYILYLFSDDKEYDIFVCYDPVDAEFALGVLVHTLEKVYHYRCFVYERDSVAGDCECQTPVQFYIYLIMKGLYKCKYNFAATKNINYGSCCRDTRDIYNEDQVK